MLDIDVVGILLLAASLLVVLVACWIYHRRLRNRSTLALFLTVAIFTVWVPVWTFGGIYMEYEAPSTDMPRIYLSIYSVLASLLAPTLIFVAASSFLLSVRTLAKHET